MYSTDVRKCIICAIVWIISVTHDMLNYFGSLVENILYEYIYLQPALKDVMNVTSVKEETRHVLSAALAMFLMAVELVWVSK